MAGRHFHLSNGSLFFVWLIAGIVLLLLPNDKTSKVWETFRNVFNPVLQIGQFNPDNHSSNPISSDSMVPRRQYDQLKMDYDNLKATLRALHADYEQLAGIRSQLPQAYGGIVLARVVGTLSIYRHDVALNKGSEEGVHEGQYVLSANKNCVVGLIFESTAHNAKMRVLTDSEQSIEVRIVNYADERDIQGLMFGNGKSACKIMMIGREKKVEVGDVVYADTKPGYLNVPIVIGEVSEVIPDDEHPLLWDITVRPAGDMTQLDEVAIIVIEDI